MSTSIANERNWNEITHYKLKRLFLHQVFYSTSDKSKVTLVLIFYISSILVLQYAQRFIFVHNYDEGIDLISLKIFRSNILESLADFSSAILIFKLN